MIQTNYEVEICSECNQQSYIVNRTKMLCPDCNCIRLNGCTLKEKQLKQWKESQQRARERQKLKPPQYKKPKPIIHKPKTPIKAKPINPLDSIFSKIIRKVHSNYCHSCGQYHNEQDLQAGHFLGRTNFATRYDLRNALPVCGQCNYYDASHVEKLGLKLIELYGENVIDELNIKKIESQFLNKSEKEILFETLNILYNSLTDCKELNFEKMIAFLNFDNFAY